MIMIKEALEDTKKTSTSLKMGESPSGEIESQERAKEKVEEVSSRRDVCWYCGGQLCWESDFNYDEVFGEGEGIATFLHCTSCGAEVQYSLRSDENEDTIFDN